MGALAHAYTRAGRAADAEEQIAKLHELSRQRYITPFAFAVAYAGLDRNDDALAWLQRALEERNAWKWFVPVDPRFDRLREDSRFTPLLQQHGLPPFLETDG
jgi:tetratricopeptide (TPR) repeat protein